MKLGNFLRILAVALALSGYSAWLQSVRDKPAAAPQPDRFVADIPLLSLAQAESLWHQEATLFIDVRSPFDYEVGHVAGAINVPYEELEQRLPEMKARLERAAALVIYCQSKDCGKSLWSAIRLRQEGLTQTRIFPGGWNEWANGGLPAHRSGS